MHMLPFYSPVYLCKEEQVTEAVVNGQRTESGKDTHELIGI